MNVSSILTTDYENKSNWTLGENKPNSNPICQRVKLMQSVYLQRIMKKNADMGPKKQSQNKPNLKRAKMNVNSFITKDYRKKDDFLVRINKPNFRNGPKRT